MNERPSNPAPQKPPHGIIDEGQLLDWIDGGLSPEDQATLEASSGRSGLRSRVAQMQANARALRALAEEKAPPGLRERVLAALERDALVAMERDGKSDAPPPISFSDHVATRDSARWSKRGPAFALAAGLLLLVGGAVYWSVLLFDHAKPTPRRDGPLAKGTTPAEVEPGPMAILTQPDAPIPETTISGRPESAAPTTLAAAFMGPPRPPMTSQRAMELAGEGRLAVRIFSDNTRGLRQVEAAGAGKSGRDWRLSKTLPPAVTLALAGVPNNTGGPLMASAHAPAATLIAPLLGPNAAFSMPTIDDPLRRVRGAYVLEVPADTESFERVEALFADSLQGRVELEELAEPVQLAPASPERVVWWTQAPTEWVPRVSIPVIVERAE